jgi:hypothetical protein
VTFALHEAVKQRNLYIVAKLLLFGANPTIQDTWCCTAYDYAKRGKDSEAQEIVKIIDAWKWEKLEDVGSESDCVGIMLVILRGVLVG